MITQTFYGGFGGGAMNTSSQEGTMRRVIIICLSIIVIVTACTPSGTGTPVAVVDSKETPSPIPTSTATPIPSNTPTPSITPLPTIPTFTPTFDASTIVTVTPAPKAECPKENDSLKPNFRLDDNSIDIEEEILGYLNNGGSIQRIIGEISEIYPYPPRLNKAYAFTDVTNDGVPDLIFDGFPTSDSDVSPIYHTFYILYCRNGQYSLFSGQNELGIALFNTVYKIIDMNKDNIPEIMVYNNKCSDTGCFSFFIGEWNGKAFVNLATHAYLEGITDGKVQDTNNDGTLELILFGGLPLHEPTWRSEIHTHIWNGKNIVEQPVEYAQPVFRFQAIQDADAAVITEKYERALQLYEEAISKKNLEWWSAERQQIEQAELDYYWAGEPTPDTKTVEDTTEYPRLAAYAYYRIMLLKLAQGNEAEAKVAYKTLQGKFGNNENAKPYIDMATDFWNAYQSSHKMYDGCAAAIEYAAEHPEILIPLGSDYHGSQSHTYVPADVCPFR
jgi:hypothetical protein